MIKKFRGFTLIEIIIVVAIIAILSVSAFLTVNPLGKINAAGDAVRISDMSALKTALESYYATNGNYPINLQKLKDQGYVKSINENPTCDQTKTNNSTCNYQYFSDTNNPAWYALYTQTASPTKQLPTADNSVSGCTSIKISSCQPGGYDATANWACIDSGNITDDVCQTIKTDTLHSTTDIITSTPTPLISNTPTTSCPGPNPCFGGENRITGRDANGCYIYTCSAPSTPTPTLAQCVPTTQSIKCRAIPLKESWYYSATTGMCTQQACVNGTGYDTQQDCEQACSQIPTYTPTPTKTMCTPYQGGICAQNFTGKWAYQTSTNSCFQPGDSCPASYFDTQQQCQQACVH